MDAYLRLSNALVAGLCRLGLAVDKAASNVRAGPDVSAACFEVPSAYEITAGGRKLIGSAQSRRARYVLQHGSLPLRGDITRLIEVLVLPAERADGLRRHLSERATTLAQALGMSPDAPQVQFASVATALADGFRTTLNLEFEQRELTPGELRESARLIREQYGNSEWTKSH
jgi:lipoate-protein ligase A